MFYNTKVAILLDISIFMQGYFQSISFFNHLLSATDNA